MIFPSNRVRIMVATKPIDCGRMTQGWPFCGIGGRRRHSAGRGLAFRKRIGQPDAKKFRVSYIPRDVLDANALLGISYADELDDDENRPWPHGFRVMFRVEDALKSNPPTNSAVY